MKQADCFFIAMWITCFFAILFDILGIKPNLYEGFALGVIYSCVYDLVWRYSSKYDKK